MKKIFTLFCAVLFVLSAGAVQSFNSDNGNSAKISAHAAEDIALTCNRVQAWWMGNFYPDARRMWHIDLWSDDVKVFEAQIYCTDESHIAGDWTITSYSGEDVDYIQVTQTDGSSSTSIVSGSFSIAYNSGTQSYDFSFSGKGKDGNNYALAYSCAPSEIEACDYQLYVMYNNGYIDDPSVYVITLQDNATTDTRETIDLIFTYTEINTEKLADEGLIEFYGHDDGYVFDFWFFVHEGINGHYTEADVFDFNYDSFFFTEIGKLEFLEVVSCSFDITENEGFYTLDGSLVCANGIQYNCSISGEPTQYEGISSVKETTPAVKLFENGQLLIERNGIRYNAAGARIR